MINKVTLVGNLGRDPELRRLPSGAAVAQFSVATNERYKDREGNWRDQTEWHEVVVWRQLAERAEQQLRKGMLVYLEGKLTTRSWQDKDGNPRKTTEVVGNYLRILNRRDDARPAVPQSAAAPAPQGASPTAPAAPPTTPAAPAAPPAPGNNDTDESDLPF